MARVTFARTDNSILTQWWWNVDRWLFVAICLLIGVGILLTMAASPPVAERIGLDSFYFVKRHFIYVLLFFVVMIGVSLLSEQNVRRFALGVFVVTFILLILTPLIGYEIKGAKRWISVIGFSLQPSEFIKPVLVILTAWMLAEKKKNPEVPGNLFALIFYGLVVCMLLLQPDMGMIFLMTIIFFTQFFLAGLPLILILVSSSLGVVGMVSAYFVFPHVQTRVDRFLNPSTQDRFNERYQITQSLDAFSSGGFWGQGPGEGIVKKHLPDGHADFIFSVGAEEYGAIFCLFIIAIFGFLVIRSLMRVMQESNMFVILAVGGGLCLRLRCKQPLTWPQLSI